VAEITWIAGNPPQHPPGKLFLLIASPLGGNFDVQADNRPAVYVGHYRPNEPRPVPARVWGMSANKSRPDLDVLYWAEIDLPSGLEIRDLTQDDLFG